MAQYPDSGAFFPNKDKAQSNQPDFTGMINISRELADGIAKQVAAGGDATIRIAGWKKVSQAGNNFIGMKASLPMDGKSSRPQPQRQAPVLDDDIPF